MPEDDDSSSTSSNSDTDEKRTPPEDDQTFLVFKSELEDLMRFCMKCGGPVIRKFPLADGTRVKYTLECHNGCGTKWSSQPEFGRQAIGNVMVAAASTLSGTSFSKLDAFSRALHLQMLDRKTKQNLQSQYVFPVVQEGWKTERDRIVNLAKETGKPVTLAGDCRCDR